MKKSLFHFAKILKDRTYSERKPYYAINKLKKAGLIFNPRPGKYHLIVNYQKRIQEIEKVVP